MDRRSRAALLGLGRVAQAATDRQPFRERRESHVSCSSYCDFPLDLHRVQLNKAKTMAKREWIQGVASPMVRGQENGQDNAIEEYILGRHASERLEVHSS